MTLISVIIPVYNGETFVARAIDSVLAQTLSPHEVIVVNDGSTDKTLDVLARYQGRIAVKTIANAGASAARNAGIAMASGELIAFLDADDIWHREKLARQAETMAKFPSAGFCCCDYHLFNDYIGATVNHFSILEGKGVNYNQPLHLMPVKLLLNVNFVGTASTVVVRKQILDEVGYFNTSYKQAEDFELWLRCAMVTQFILLSEVLVDKKTHATNLTNDLKESYLFHQQVLRDVKEPLADFLAVHGLTADYISSVVTTNYKLANIHYNEGRYKEAFSYYREGLRAAPTAANFIQYCKLVGKKLLRYCLFDFYAGKGLYRVEPK